MKVTLVRGLDDSEWEGLYLNGRLVEQGHHISLVTAMQRIQMRQTASFDCTPVEFEVIDADSVWLESIGWLPDDIGKVKGAAP
jgi:hypothetical protein